jgi:hypothetical protein
MEQRAVIRLLTLKGVSLRTIMAEVESVDQTKSLALPTAKKWRKRIAEGITSLCGQPRSGRGLTSDLAEDISSMLKRWLVLACKILCRHFRIARATCLCVLHDTIRMKKFNLRWFSHALNGNQKGERVTLSQDILSILQSTRATGFQNEITGDDES